MWREKGKEGSKGAASGLVALVFLVLGFQLAIFVVKVVDRPQASETAGVFPESEHFSASDTETRAVERAPRRSDHQTVPVKSPTAVIVPVRTYESFAFDPNTVSLDDLQRLGLTLRQAESIENYRSKGGRFRTKTDFLKMYVVSDTLYARLEAFIEIARLELNTADSTALVELRGIGPYYARKILEYRDRLGGFQEKEQLLEIEGFDAERLAGFSDDIEIDTSRIRPLDIWRATDSMLARHPYLGAKGARSIARYKQLYDTTRWTLADLERERVLPKENIEKLKKYIVIQ